MPSKRKKNKKATRRINDSPSAMRVHHPTGEGTTTPKMDNKRSGGFDNETKSQIQKRDDDPSIIGTVVTTLPSPSSLSRNSTNSTAKNEREGCSTVSNQVLSDQKPRAAEVSSNDDLKEMLAKMNESLSHLNMQVSDLNMQVSDLTSEKNTMREELSHLSEKVSQQEKQISQQEKQISQQEKQISQQEKQISQQNKQISGLTTDNETVNGKLSDLTREHKTMKQQSDAKFKELNAKYEEVNRELKEQRDVTTVCEVANAFGKAIVQVMVDSHPPLKTSFKGKTPRDLVIHFHKNPSLFSRAKQSNPEGKGFPLDLLWVFDEACTCFAQTRNEMNHKRWPGHGTPAKSSFFCKVRDLVPNNVWKKTRADLNVISEKMNISPEKQGVKK